MRKYISLLLASVVSSFTIVVTRLRTRNNLSPLWISLMLTFWRLRRRCPCPPHRPAPCRLRQRLDIATFASRPSTRTGQKFISSTSRLCFAGTVSSPLMTDMTIQFRPYPATSWTRSRTSSRRLPPPLPVILMSAPRSDSCCSTPPPGGSWLAVFCTTRILATPGHRSSCPRCWRCCRAGSHLVFSSRPPG